MAEGSPWQKGHGGEPNRRNPDGSPRTDEEYKRAKDDLAARDAGKPLPPHTLFTDPTSPDNIAARNKAREQLGMPLLDQDGNELAN